MKIPDNIYMNICKVFQEIYKNKFELNELNIAEVGSRGKNMTCRYRITVQEEMQNVKFSYYDAAVYDAVYTLYKTNYSKFTLTDLLRVMSGDEKVRFYCTKSRIQKREQKLRDSLEKLRNTTIAIDYSEEVQMRNMQDEKGKPLKGFVADYLVPVAVEKNGKAYWFLEGRELPVYKYAEDIGQMISVPRELLDPAGLLKTMFPAKEFQESEEGKKLLENVKFSSTDEMILLKRILIQRLETMRNSRNNADGRRIRYYAIKKEEGILPMAGIYRENFEQDIRFVSDRGKVRFESRGWKNKVHAVNKKLCAILDIYKKCGYVTEYELLRNEPRSLVRGLEILGEIKKVELRKKRETETSAEKTAEVK